MRIEPEDEYGRMKRSGNVVISDPTARLHNRLKIILGLTKSPNEKEAARLQGERRWEGVMACCICGKVALYKAGGKEFCKSHLQDAKDVSTRATSRTLSMSAARSGHEGNVPKNKARSVSRKYNSKGGYGKNTGNTGGRNG